jgi:hypothetical protein
MNQWDRNLVKRVGVFLCLITSGLPVHAVEVAVEACVSTLFNEKQTGTDVGGFASTCYPISGSAVLDENINFKKISDSENRVFFVGLCNESGSKQTYVQSHELKYRISKLADVDERVDVRIHYSPIPEVAREGEGTLAGHSEFEMESGLCADFLFTMSSSYNAFTGASDTLTSQQDINGLFYDPSNPGHGFDFNLHELGLTIFYYGHSSDGERLWLISEPYADAVQYWEEISLTMYEVEDGTFGMPGDEVEWGTLKVKLTGCDEGYAILEGNDGQMTVNIERLVGLPDSVCRKFD